MSQEAIEKTPNWKKKPWGEYARKALRAGSTLALVLAQLRNSKGPSGWIAIGISAASLILDAHNQWKEITSPDVWDYFNDRERWEAAPSLLRKVIVKNCTSVTQISENQSTYIFQGYLGDELVAWRSFGGQVDYGPFFLRGSREKALKILGEMLWDQVGSQHAVLSKQGTIEASEESLEGEVIIHKSLEELQGRVLKFIGKNENRSYLLEGPPGSGKSTAIRHLLKELDLRSLRINFDDANDGNRWDGSRTAFNTTSLIEMMEPDFLIIDDFERNYMDERELLHLMEVANKHCRVVLATVNNKSALSGAMTRVGRFDDHILIDKIPLEIVKLMLDPDLHVYARKCASWPIAYIKDLNTRKKILGLEAAHEEFPEMHLRATGKKIPSKKKTKRAAKTSTKKRSSKQPTKVGKKVSKRASRKKTSKTAQVVE